MPKTSSAAFPKPPMPWDPDYADYMDEQSNEVDLQQLFTERQAEFIRAAQQDSDDHANQNTLPH